MFNRGLSSAGRRLNAVKRSVIFRLKEVPRHGISQVPNRRIEDHSMPIKEHHLENLQEAETYLWVKEGLERLDKLLQSIDADDDLLDLIDYLKDENEQWCDPEMLEQAEISPKSVSS